MKKKLEYLIAGILFGFTLSRSGASEYDMIHQMFTGENLKLALLMGTAIITAMIGMRILKLLGNKDIEGREIKISKKPLKKYAPIGGALFGIGWAVTGACPGTVLAQLGEGKVLALFTLLGMMTGTYIYALLAEEHPGI